MNQVPPHPSCDTVLQLSSGEWRSYGPRREEDGEVCFVFSGETPDFFSAFRRLEEKWSWMGDCETLDYARYLALMPI